MNRIRVAHLVSHPIQYFVPLYRALAKRPEIDLTVYFYSGQSLREHVDSEFGRTIRWDVPLIGGYNYCLNEKDLDRRIAHGFDGKPNWSIVKQIADGEYDVVWLHGYASLNAYFAVALSRLRKIPVLLRDDQTLLTPRSPVKRFLKKVLLPPIFKNVHGLYVGESNQRFFEEYGTKSLFRFRYCVDNGYLRKRHAELRPRRAEVRASFGVTDEAPVILFSGKLIDKKKPYLLLEAFERLRKTARCHLLFAGDGALRAGLEETVTSRTIPDVHFAGFLNQTKLPFAYTAADLLALPSAYQETWGLVVNEAMNFSLPVVVSDRVGCAADLIRPGENGCIFASGDVGQLEAVLRECIWPENRRLSYGRRSAEIIEDYSIENSAAQIVNACLSATRRPDGHFGTIAHQSEASAQS
jgi:glycosyltransferase involved in cell wall biosynthesis